MNNELITTESGFPLTASPLLVKALAEGMHALAQPLGVLQGTIETALLDAGAGRELQSTMELSLTEVERASGLLGYLQQLLGVCRHRLQPEAIEMGKLLVSVAADLKLVFEQAGVGIELDCPELLPMVYAVRARTREALFYSLQAAQALAAQGNRVTARVEAYDRYVQVVVENPERWLAQGSLATDASLRKLTLAQMIILSQHGEFEWDGEPFSVRFALPLAASTQSAGMVDAFVTQ